MNTPASAVTSPLQFHPPGPAVADTVAHAVADAGADAFVRNSWYACASSSEVGRELRPVRLLGERLVLYRTEAGQPVALLDRCPHRFAPLSLGKLRGDLIECGYHGMSFDCSGACVRVPAQARIPPLARARSFPALERYGLVFVWMGEAEKADPAILIDIPQYGQPRWGVSRGYSYFRANYQNITDNLVDPAHTSFVHATTIGNAAAEDVAIETTVEGDVLTVGRWIADSPPVPVIRRFTGIASNMDRWQLYRLKAPCTSWVDFGAFAPGSARTEEAKDAAPYRVLSYAFLTPESAGTTHYFWFQLRNFAAGDEAVTREFETLYKTVFDEDRALLEAIERIEQENPGVAPVRIASDAGLVRLRRMVSAMLEAERGTTAAESGGSQAPPGSRQAA